ncbi:hypothetical protein [Neolewinella agarilytica]|uniref:hypothetical protein n=1 Tax=Neolewinella agarilytica TaxID=478744 RepID=UPI002353C535|nr:hypothetical protein [Neolewinella agarilytica]
MGSNKKKRNKKYNPHKRYVWSRKKFNEELKHQETDGFRRKIGSLDKTLVVVNTVLLLIFLGIGFYSWSKYGFKSEKAPLYVTILNIVVTTSCVIPGLTTSWVNLRLKNSGEFGLVDIRSKWRTIIISLPVSTSLVFMAILAKGFFYYKELSFSNYFLLLYLVLFSIHEYIVVYGFFRPKIIFNKFIVSLSKGVRQASYFCLFYFFFSILYAEAKVSIPNFLAGLSFIFAFNVALNYLFGAFSSVTSVGQIIKFSKVSNMRLALAEHHQSRFAKVKAENEFRNMMAKGDEEVLQLIAKKVNEENGKSRSSNWLGSIVVVVVVFFLTSIGEGLVQDLFNDQLKEYICRTINVFC